LDELRTAAYKLCNTAGWGLKYELGSEINEFRIVLPQNIFENIDEIQRNKIVPPRRAGLDGKHWNPYCGKI
jgi:hypothetical protein